MFERIDIRTRIAGGSFLIAVLIAVVAGILIEAEVERIVRDGTLEVLISETAPYLTALADEPDEELDAPGPSHSIAVIDGNGQTRIDSLPAGVGQQTPVLTEGTETRTIDSLGTTYLVRTTAVEVRGARWQVIAARDLVSENGVLERMRLLIGGGLTVIAVSVAGTAWALTSASLGPVRRLRRSAEELSAGPSTALLPVGSADDEISRLAVTLNDLILRLRAASAHERQLVSDASHELRTPLAILRTQLELARREASSVDQLVRDVQAAEASADRLGRLMSSLLELSSIEASGHRGTSTVAELRVELTDAVSRAGAATSEVGVEIILDLAPGGDADMRVGITTDDAGRVVDNLLSNAISAGRGKTAGPIRVGLVIGIDEVRMLVQDSAGGLDPDFAPKAFDRFTRADDSRHRGPGSGLGLAIVAALVERADGAIRLRNDWGSGLTVTICVPSVDVAVQVVS